MIPALCKTILLASVGGSAGYDSDTTKTDLHLEKTNTRTAQRCIRPLYIIHCIPIQAAGDIVVRNKCQ